MSKKLELVGKRFGRLLVLREMEERYNGRHCGYWVRCDCGREIKIRSFALVTRNTRSCGCLRREMWQLPEGEAAKNDMYRNYLTSAKKTGRTWEIPLDKFKELIGKNCHYCGIAPANIWRAKRSNFRYNGLDRVDNSKGYVLDNVVTCCGECNMAKKQRSVDEFISHCKRVIAHSG